MAKKRKSDEEPKKNVDNQEPTPKPKENLEPKTQTKAKTNIKNVKQINSESKPKKRQSEDGEDEEGLLTSQKEINATLDMVIREIEFGELEPVPPEPDDDTDCDSGGDNDVDIDDDIDDDDDDEGDIIIPRPSIPIPDGGVNLFLTCVDLFIFELDDDVLEKLVLCAIVSMSFDKFQTGFKRTFFPRRTSTFRTLEAQLDERISSTYNQLLLQVMSGIQQASNKKDYIKNLFQSHLISNDRHRNILELLSRNLQSMLRPGGCGNEFDEVIKQFERIVRSSALAFLYSNLSRKLAEFQNAVGIKVGCIEADLTFLSTEILRFTSEEAGILPLSNALALVTSARFAEEDEFDEVFDAVEELADAIEQLAEIYQDRLKVLRALLPFSLCPRPLIIPEIPDDDLLE